MVAPPVTSRHLPLWAATICTYPVAAPLGSSNGRSWKVSFAPPLQSHCTTGAPLSVEALSTSAQRLAPAFTSS